MERPTIVCLCGSTRFGDAFHEANLKETLAGKIVLSIGCDFKSDADLLLAGSLTPEDKARLDELHLRKIDLADEVLILNVGGYVGESTRREIAYAREHGKRIRWLKPVCQYPGCIELATITCSMIACLHKVCETHGNGGIEDCGEYFPLCRACDGKGWGDERVKRATA